jgi:hypothetical protein
MRAMCFLGAFVLCSITFVNMGNAATAVYQPQNGWGDISVQGFNGPMALPVVQAVPNNGDGNPVGGTASNTALYALFNPSTSGANSTISINDAQSGAYEGSIALNGSVSDIAYTNGQLYGLQVNSASIQIVSVSNTGTITPLVAQTATTPSGVTWRLSGAVNGDSLLATALPTFTGPTSGYVIDPASSQVSPFTFSPAPAAGGINCETILNVAGNAVTLNDVGTQYQYDYPSGANGVQIPTSAQYPFGIVSDEFTYNYGPTNPAYVNLNYSPSIPSSYDNLLRTPPSFTIQTTMYNGAAPDGTTISNVAVASGQQLWTQQSGPSTLQINETASAPGSFSNRVVATDTISLSGAQRGIYSYAVTPNVLTGDYTYGNTTDLARVVSNQSATFQFAYDPVSSNLVGNGDLSLGTAGWECDPYWSEPGTTTFIQEVALRNEEMVLEPSSSSAYAVRQLLQLPTSGSSMLLSFDYNALVARSPASLYNVDVQIYLNSTLLGELDTDSTTIQDYQTVIGDPSLQNLSGAYLTFVASGTGANGVELGDISLTAVPEPNTLGLFLVGLALAHRRRRACRG